MRRLPLALLGAFALLGLLGVERPRGLGDVVEVRHWSYPNYTRVVVELTQPVRTVVRELPADRGSGKPARLYLDLAGVWVGRRFADGLPVGDGLLQGVRVGQNTTTSARLVLDLERYERHRLIELSHPDRVVIDVYGRRDGDHAALPRGPSDSDSLGRLPLDLRPVDTIVIDAGHGGRDPGAIGVGGLREKDVTLRLARNLGDKLAARGFAIIYTRHDDRTIGLEERTAIAESVGGDLFVSLHANAAPRRSVSGIETYYLDANHERHSLGVAARENGILPRQVDALQRTVAKLRVSEVSVHSRRVANTVHQQMVAGLAGRYREVIDLGVKKGPFYVLFLSNMPAILVEAGFLTNQGEARRLRDVDYLDELAQQISIGLVRYRETSATVALGHTQ
jgi:N-acetylmuramoyl-L-alanine amidase